MIADKRSPIILYTVIAVLFVLSLFGIYKEYRGAKSYTFDPALYPSPSDSCVFSLPKGNYTIDISYGSQTDFSITLKTDNDYVADIPLPADNTFVSFPFTMEHPTDRAKFTINAEDPSSSGIKEISLHAQKYLYTDFFFHLALLIFLTALALILVVNRSRINRKHFFFLLIVAVIVNLPLFIFRGSNFGVDTRAHMLRLAGVVNGLLDRQLPVIISPNYLNEFGELSFIYPDLFFYPFAVLRILGVSMYTVYRFMMVVINIATVISVYFSAKIMCKKDPVIFAAVILYAFEAHRLRIMYMNGAGGGAGVAQIFIPLCIAGFYLIVNEKNKLKGSFLLAFGITGVMESHIMSLFLLAVFLVALSLSFIKNLLKDKCLNMRYLILSVVLTLIMNGGFLVIFLKYYFSDWSSAALFWSDFISWCLKPYDIITSPQSHFYLIMLTFSIILLIMFRKNRSTVYHLSLSMTVITGIIYFMSTSFFPWKILMDSFKPVYTIAMFIQQAHRFFSLIEAPAVFCPLLLLSDNDIIEDGKFRKPALVTGLILSLMLVTGIISEMKMFFSNDPILFNRICGDYNTLLLLDYVPEGTTEESIKYDTGKLSDESAVESLSYHKRGTHIDYSYICNKEGVYADLPLLYYEGYSGTDENNAPVTLRKGKDGHILADLNGDGAGHELHVRFRVSPLFTILWLISPCLMILISVIFYAAGPASSKKRGTI